MAIFGGGKKVEPQFKKIYKSRISSTGMSEALRDLDSDFSAYDHLDALSKAKLPINKSASEKLVKDLGKALDEIDKVLKKKKVDWTPAESKFLKELTKEIEDQKTAIDQAIEKGQKEAKESSSAEDLIIKAQQTVLSTTLPKLEKDYETVAEDVADHEEYVKNQGLKIDKVVESGSDELDVESSKNILQGLVNTVLSTHKKVTSLSSSVAKSVEAVKKGAKICVNNKKVQELNKQIIESENKLNDKVNQLDKRMVMARNQLGVIIAKLSKVPNKK